MKSRVSPYDRITERIINLLESGVCPWRRPWNQSNLRPQNFDSKHLYQGINFFLLECMGFDLPVFLTFRKVKAMGGSVRKGSKGIPIVFWGTWKLQDPRGDETEVPKKIPFLKHFTVFNAAHIEGIDFPEPEDVQVYEFNPISRADDILASWGDRPEIHANRKFAAYDPIKDLIFMPPESRFQSPESYYATLFHEMGHATGAPHRLNREKGNFGDEQYSREELVAEMTSAFLCEECRIDNSTLENSAAYLGGWIKALKGNSKMVIQAASQAQKAANYILGINSSCSDKKMSA